MRIKSSPARKQQGQALRPYDQWTSGSLCWALFYRVGGDYLVRFPDIADFAISHDGRTVTQVPVPGVGEATLQHLYRNQILPLALSRQGQFVFHGSAVEIDRVAVAFLGESGRGKSTLALSFARDGCGILTDDALFVSASEDGYCIAPGDRLVRLWPDSERAILGKAAHRLPVPEYTTKNRFEVDEMDFVSAPRQLRMACFLGDGSSNSISFRRLLGTEALMGWIKNSFVNSESALPNTNRRTCYETGTS